MSDRQLYLSLQNNKKWLSATLVFVSLAAFGAWNTPEGSETVSASLIEVAAVTQAPFSEKVNIRGTYIPEQSVYLDAVEGGRVEELLVEEGQLVTKGQPLLVLSNTRLQLDVISREAQVSEQLNNLQNTQLAIEQNALKLKQDLINFNYQIRQLERKHKQNETLLAQQLISEEMFHETLDELNYLRSARELTVKSQEVDDQLRQIQLKQLTESVKQLKTNLAFARKNLENLIVKAPIDGQLSSFNVELGQSKAQGERLGQIDNLSGFKVQANIDEFYLNNVYLGQLGTTYVSGQSTAVAVSKIYSQVENGKFKVELNFPEPIQNKMRRGQNLTIELALSDESDVLQLPLGGFVQDTGGQWAFVVTAEGNKAERRAITLGRENGVNVEVLQGLSEGENVVISPYRDIANVSQLHFDFNN